MTLTMTKTMTKTKTNTFREHLKRATPETCDPREITPETLTDLPTYLHTYPPTYLPTYVPPLENTLKERSERLVTFETFDQSDEGT